MEEKPQQMQEQFDYQTIFHNIEPLKQFPTKSGQAPIVAINYTQDFQKPMSYFRAILKSEQVSKRAYQLTSQVISVNPGNYTAWHWRRRCIDELNLSLAEEIQFLDQIGAQNEKCYQYWHHRRLVLQKLGAPYSGEEDFIKEIIDSDAKNYHAWTYHQWYIQHYKLFKGQKERSQKLIESDLKNNTFWTFRYFLVANQMDQSNKQKSKDVVKEEIMFAISKIKENDKNEAAWAYLRGFLKARKSKNQNIEEKSYFYYQFPEVEQFVKGQSLGQNRFALATLADIEESKKNIEQTSKIYLKLANQIDPLRKNYYLWKSNRIKNQINQEKDGEEQAKGNQ